MLGQRIRSGCLRQLVSRNGRRMGHATSNSPPQYDVSEKMKKLFELKQKQREATKAYFQKIIMNPHRPKEDPVPFDPVLFRYNALMTYHSEYYKPNLKNQSFMLGLYIMPIVITAIATYYYKKNQERKFRAGEVAYEDRHRGFL